METTCNNAKGSKESWLYSLEEPVGTLKVHEQELQ